MRDILVMFTLLNLFPATAVAEELFELKRVTEGVYAAIAKPAYKINCNAAVILLHDSVLVVDTHSKPSAARALIDQIKTVTDTPVRWVVDTHFHWDHYQGNSAYVNTWPSGLEIISSTAARDGIVQKGIPRIKFELATAPRQIEQLREQRRSAPGDEKAVLQENLRQLESYLAELKQMEVTLPTVTFDRSLVLHDRSRTVQILWLGRGHTDGDIVVYLPREKIVASGDLLQGAVPFMGDSYPFDWIRTLGELEKLDFDQVIGGHGEVMQGKSQLRLWKEYLSAVMEETTRACSGGLSLAETVEKVSPLLISRFASRFPPGRLEAAVTANIQKAYRVITGAQQ